MLTIYRRHLKGCEHRKSGRKYRRCRCPIWVDGILDQQEVRKSMHMRDWDRAQAKVREWESEQSIEPEQPEGPKAVQEACNAYLADAAARNLTEATLRKYRLLFKQLRTFSERLGIRYLKELNIEKLREFRASWNDHNHSAQKKLERLKSFFRFALDSRWIDTNAAKLLTRPKVSQRPTMPFSREEIQKILATCDRFGEAYQGESRAAQNSRRMRAFILMLRYTGLRIQDLVTLARQRVVSGKVFLYTAKTGTPVYLPLPPAALEALNALPRTGKRYFSSDEGRAETATRNWQNSLRNLFSVAGVPDGHAHRFRDTFAVELLLTGVPIERVSVLLGHSSAKVTEKYYAPWIKARQEQLEADVRRAWADDPVTPSQTKGTWRVHGQGVNFQTVDNKNDSFGGEGGIRTHVPAFGRQDAFEAPPL